MTECIRLRHIVLTVGLLLAVTLAHAQFQQPTDEELKMASDPKNPGAAAIILNQEELDNDPRHVRTIYKRIKILTEKGKELSTVNIPYVNEGWGVTDIQARTIHADGTIIPLTGKPEEILLTQTEGFKVSRKVFHLPSVEVGSILEYRYDLYYDRFFSTPEWEIQQPYSIRKAHYSFIPYDNFKPGVNLPSFQYLTDGKGRAINALVWVENLPPGVKIEGKRGIAYEVNLENLPPLPEEDFMPPAQNLAYKVRFYYKPEGTVNDFWKDSTKEWSKSVDHFAEANGFIKDEVAKLIAPTDSDLDKAKKLYAAVQALDNTDYSRSKSESERQKLKLKDIQHAEDVWKQKSGNSEQIAMLYLAMLRAVEMKAYGVKVVNRDKGEFDPSYMYMHQLNDMLVQVDISGKLYTLDPGEKMCPFGIVNWKHAGVRGLGQDDKKAGLAELPHLSYRDNSVSRTAVLTLDGQGNIQSGIVQFAYTGQVALEWRQKALENDPEEMKKLFDHALEDQLPEGVEAHLDHFQGMENSDVNLVAYIKVSGRLGAATSKRLVFPGQFFDARGHRPFVEQEKRQTPVDMHYARKTTDQVTYKFPADYTVEGVPADGNIKWENHSVYLVKTARQAGNITVARVLMQAFDQAKPDEYQELRGFYQKVATADQQQIVLTAQSAIKGN